MTSGKGNYEVRSGDFDSDGAAIVSLLLEGFEEFDAAIAQRKINWMYKENPAGEGLVYLLWDKTTDSAVGVQCLGVHNWRVGERQLKSGNMADFVVGKKHRSLGPALQLLKGVLAQGGEALDIIYGFPNRKARPVFKRAGYKELGGMVRYAKILRSERFLADRLPTWLASMCAKCFDSLIRFYAFSRVLFISASLKGEWLENFDGRFNKLWDNNQNATVLTSIRNAKSLKWRFRGEKSKDTRIFSLKKNNNDLLGYIVVSVTDRVAVISDFYAVDKGKAFQQLFSLFYWQAAKLGCESVSLEFFGDQTLISKLKKEGFVGREENPVYYLPCTDDPASLNKLEWYMTGFDRDT